MSGWTALSMVLGLVALTGSTVAVAITGVAIAIGWLASTSTYGSRGAPPSDTSGRAGRWF